MQAVDNFKRVSGALVRIQSSSWMEGGSSRGRSRPNPSLSGSQDFHCFLNI